MLVVLGGDGTILRTARLLGPAVKPIASINTGRLGFLTTGTEAEVDRLIATILSQSWRLTRRSVVEASFRSASGESFTEGGLNEITVTRGSFSRMIRLEVRVDGEFLNRYSADGLIVSTPTGSTAYSLSAGGPIIAPDAGVFCLTPICPHALSNRPLVVSDTVTIEIQPVEPIDELLLNVDGGPAFVPGISHPVRIRKAPWTVPLVTFREHSFHSILRDKLRWTGDSF